MPTSRYFTTPLYYVNASPHIGHYYTTMLVDTLSRHYRSRGESVYFLTGTDEHGQKVSDSAKKEGVSPKQFVDRIAGDFRSTWEACSLEFDRFYRTTDPDHIKKVQHALTLLKDKGEIVLKEYEGLYDVGAERFVTESELNPDGLIAETLTKPELRKESNYFFKMSRYQDRLIEFFESNANSIRPNQYRNEILSFLKNQPLEDLCISRPRDRLEWGIELPFDKGFVTYVWFDALLNYLIAAGWPDNLDEAKWKNCVHFIAKDIVKAHGIYWTAMLYALGVGPYKELRVHGYWMVGDTKMSKTIGNVVRPLEVKEKFGLESLRFYLLREMSFGLDSTFTFENFIQCSNAYLANGIGNLVSRVLTIAIKNLGGEIKVGALGDAENKILALTAETLKTWDTHFEDIKYQLALKQWSELVTALDLYINDNKPWALAKDPAQLERLHTVLGVSTWVIQSLAVLIYPVLPQASAQILRTMGKPELKEHETPPIAWFSERPTQIKLVGEVPKLFPRIQLEPDTAPKATKK